MCKIFGSGTKLVALLILFFLLLFLPMWPCS